jgi:hypothetical protein
VNGVGIEIRRALPTTGAKLARLVATGTERGVAYEYAFIRDYLAAGNGKRKKRE